MVKASIAHQVSSNHLSVEAQRAGSNAHLLFELVLSCAWDCSLHLQDRQHSATLSLWEVPHFRQGYLAFSVVVIPDVAGLVPAGRAAAVESTRTDFKSRHMQMLLPPSCWPTEGALGDGRGSP